MKEQNQTYFNTEGELVLDYANKILKLCREADTAFMYFKNFEKISLKIGSTKLIGTNISLKLINLFCKRYRYAKVELQLDCTKSISWDIINGQIDIGIVPEDEVPKKLYYSFYATPYFEEKIVLILPKSYEYKYKNKMSKGNLYKLNLITIKPYFQERKFIDNILKNFNIDLKQLKIKLELNSIEAVKNAVETGSGASFLSTILVKKELSSKRIYSILIDSINIRKQFILLSSRKKSESHLSNQFYNSCFIILRANKYNKFINLS